MKNLKRILSFFIVMGFMFMMFGFRVGVKAANQTWDLTISSFNTETESTESVSWESTYVNMVLTKETSSTNANNALGGKTNGNTTYTNSRMYKDQKLTFTPASGYQIDSITMIVTDTKYATACVNSTWTNASASANSKTVTITPTVKTNNVVATFSGACWFTSVTVSYSTASQEASIVVTGTNYLMVGGETVGLTATPSNITPTPGSFSWQSSNTGVATVSNTGVVTAVAMGTTNITASASGTTSSAFTIKVYPSNASNISVATALEIAEFSGEENSPYNYSCSGTVKTKQSNTKFILTDGNNDILVFCNSAHGLLEGNQVAVTGKLQNYQSNTPEFYYPTLGYTIMFDSNGGSPSYDSLTGIASGTKISSPGNPTRSDYTFTGWFNGNTEWDFENNTVTGPLTLTAHWASNAAQTAINNALESTNAYISLAYAYTLNKIENPSTYTKVTSISHLSDGDSVIVVFTKSDSSCVALNTAITSNKTTGTTVTVENDAISTGIEDSCCWTLIRNNDGTWKLKNGTEYLYFTESNMSCGVTGSNLDLHITNTDSYFTATVNDKVRTAIYRDTYDIRSYAASNIGASGYSHVNLYVKQATAKYSFRDVDFRIRCAIDEGLGDLNEDYAVTFGIEVSAGGNTVKYANGSGASFQTADSKQFVTLKLGDMLNTNYADLDTEFTIRAYVEYQGAYFYSTNTKTYSVKGMVDYYYNNQHIDAVSGLKEILENYGYTFE